MAFVKCPLSHNVCGHNRKYFAAGMKWRRPSILGFKPDFLLSYFCFACEFERHVAPQALRFTITIFHNYEKQQWSAKFWVFSIEIHKTTLVKTLPAEPELSQRRKRKRFITQQILFSWLGRGEKRIHLCTLIQTKQFNSKTKAESQPVKKKKKKTLVKNSSFPVKSNVIQPGGSQK